MMTGYSARYRLLLPALASLVAGGASAQDLHLLAPTADRFAISPDSRLVAFVARDPDDNRRLEVVPIEGGTPTLLYDTSVFGVLNGSDFEFSPDSKYVVFRATTLVHGWTLMSVPSSGPSSAAIPLSMAQPAGEGTSVWAISSDSGYVVYLSADESTDSHLYTVPIAGPAGARERLDDLSLTRYDSVDQFQLSRGGELVIFDACLFTQSICQLWAAPVNGSVRDAYLLSKSRIAGGTVLSSWGPGLPSSDERVVYEGILDDPNRVDLYSSPLHTDKPESTLLTQAGLADSVSTEAFQISDNGEWVTYFSATYSDPVPRVTSAPLRGVPKWNRVLDTPPGYVYPGFHMVKISPTSKFVLYRKDFGFNLRYDLFSVPVRGPSSRARQISPVIPDTDRVGDFEFVGDGSQAVFGVRRSNGHVDGYRTPIDGSSPPELVWTDQCGVAESDWIRTELGNDFAIVRCEPESSGRQAIDLLRVVGTPNPGMLSLTPESIVGPGDLIEPDFEWSPDRRWAVFRVSSPPLDPYPLYSRQVPFYWDGFESGGLDNWSAISQ